MSRIVVKNLPKKITVPKLQEVFSTKGQVTEVTPKYTKNGIFRQFAFIGYKTGNEAQAAKEYFNNTFIQTSKIKVEMCRPLGDDSVKPWSKYSKTTKGADSTKQAVIHQKPKKHEAKLPEDAEVKEEKEESDDNTHNTSDEGTEENSDSTDPQVSRKLSDMEYLKSKMKKSSIQKKQEEVPHEEFTVKLKKLPFSCKKKHLKKFFLPLKPLSIRIPPRNKGFAYVGFHTEKDLKKALNKNRGILEGKMVDVVKYEKKMEQTVPQVDDIKTENQRNENAAELIAETGRLFVRNLCFSVTEEELREHFSKYGTIAEINVPLDYYSKKGVGYAHVTYVFAEHAVKAYSELDGTDFQGRMLHVIPGEAKKEYEVDLKAKTFKEKKVAKQKTLAHSSYNWNTLFLGQSAVADALVDQYNVSKSDLFSSETTDSAAVRMALGETQLVVETRKFLMQYGVQLDAFSQPAAEHSKTVIIVKNLPAKTLPRELRDAFNKFGTVKRVILPPSGVSALVEFQEPSEAQVAYTKLAYSRFKYKPLFLQWAPLNVLSAEPSKENIDDTAEENISSETEATTKDVHRKADDDGSSDQEDADDEEKEECDIPLEGTTIFVKNLNFETTEESFKKHFRGCGSIHSVTISRKKDLESGKLLSMGFGFVQFKKKSSALEAIQDLQRSYLDGHALELKFANRALMHTGGTTRKRSKMREATTKICVRNIPFQATKEEIQSLFEPFGELKFVRLPRKTGSSGHRGFGFVCFVRKSCAKKAFEALCHSTHLLGRRLVLEWAATDTEDVDTIRKRAARDMHQCEPERRVKKSKLMEDALLAKPDK